jgi:hypothetical protein
MSPRHPEDGRWDEARPLLPQALAAAEGHLVGKVAFQLSDHVA